MCCRFTDLTTKRHDRQKRQPQRCRDQFYPPVKLAGLAGVLFSVSLPIVRADKKGPQLKKLRPPYDPSQRDTSTFAVTAAMCHARLRISMSERTARRSDSGGRSSRKFSMRNRRHARKPTTLLFLKALASALLLIGGTVVAVDVVGSVWAALPSIFIIVPVLFYLFEALRAQVIDALRKTSVLFSAWSAACSKFAALMNGEYLGLYLERESHF